MLAGISNMSATSQSGHVTIRRTCDGLQRDALSNGGLALRFDVGVGSIPHTFRVLVSFSDTYESAKLINEFEGVAVAELVSWVQDEVTEAVANHWPVCPLDGSPMWLNGGDTTEWRCQEDGHTANLGHLSDLIP